MREKFVIELSHSSLKFLEGLIICFTHFKGFSKLPFIFIRFSSWNLEDHFFLNFFLNDRFRFGFSYLFGSCNSHTNQYHHTHSMGNSLGNIPPAGTYAGLCFIFMYWNATSVSLMTSVIRFLTETDVFSLFLIFCQTYWESAHNILTAISVGQWQTGSISYKFW